MVIANGLTLDVEPGCCAIVRLGPRTAVPEWFQASGFAATVSTPESLTLVCAEAIIPRSVPREGGRRLLTVRGPLPFDAVRILAAIAAPLAAAGIPIFVLSSFEADHILIEQERFDRAVSALRSAGHRVETTRPE